MVSDHIKNCTVSRILNQLAGIEDYYLAISLGQGKAHLFSSTKVQSFFISKYNQRRIIG